MARNRINATSSPIWMSDNLTATNCNIMKLGSRGGIAGYDIVTATIMTRYQTVSCYEILYISLQNQTLS